MQKERFVGSIVGLAVGDALGYPAEFRTRAQILAEVGPQGITGFLALQDPRFSRPLILGPNHPPGTYTDDTQMSLAVARGLLAKGAGDRDTLMEEIARHFVRWAESADNNRSPGGTCMSGCANLAQGVVWHKAGIAQSKGCGSAMRVAPIGLYYWEDLDRVADVARDSSRLTHGHDAALEGAAAAALLVALALRGATPEEMYSEVNQRCSPKSRDFAACFQRIPAMLQMPPEIALSKRGLGEGWVAEEAVASALYCVFRHPDSYPEGVLEAVNTDGDSDSLAAITGSILGALLGISAIPTRWAQEVEDAGELRRIAQQLYAASQARIVSAG